MGNENNLFSYQIDQLSGICGEKTEINEHAGSQKHQIQGDFFHRYPPKSSKYKKGNIG